MPQEPCTSEDPSKSTIRLLLLHHAQEVSNFRKIRGSLPSPRGLVGGLSTEDLQTGYLFIVQRKHYIYRQIYILLSLFM